MSGAITPCRRAAKAPLATEVDVPAAERDGLDGAHGQRGQRAQGDERVHAGGPVAGQPGAVPQERPAPGELHGDGQEQHDPSGGRRLGADQGDGQRRPEANGHEMTPAGPSGPGRDSVRRAGRRPPVPRCSPTAVTAAAQFVGSAGRGRRPRRPGVVARLTEALATAGSSSEGPLDPGGTGAAVHAAQRRARRSPS